MQLKYNRQPKIGNTLLKISIKLIFLFVFFVIVIFLIEKNKISKSRKNIKLMLLMRLKSFSYLICLLIFFFFSSLLGEDKIDIWKDKQKIEKKSQENKTQEAQEKTNIKSSQTIKSSDKIEIQSGDEIQSDEQKIFGIYEPADYDLTLSMWANTKAEDLKSSLKRLDKIELSKSSKEILEIILFSFSYPPNGMTEKEFVKLKINWLIENERINLIESF